MQNLAAKRNLELRFLPPYAPNFNLIERLWKFIRKDGLNGRYHPTHQQFQQAVLESLAAVNARHQEPLKRTRTLQFQTLENVQLLAA